MFPLYDDTRHDRTPFITVLLIGLCAVVFLLQVSQGGQAAQELVISLGFIPARVFTPADLPPDLAIVPGWGTLLTSVFVHGSLMHLAGNLLYLWLFGRGVEASMSRIGFLLFYLLAGIAATLSHAFLDPGSRVPLVGASGAISGILGAYILLFPRANVQVWVLPAWFLSIPAILVLAAWFGLQLLIGLSVPSDGGGIALWAHVGGFVAGVTLAPFFKRPDVRFFAAGQHRPFQLERRRSGDPKDSLPD